MNMKWVQTQQNVFHYTMSVVYARRKLRLPFNPCKAVVNILIQLLLFSLNCLWYLSSLARPQLLFWVLLNRKIICYLSCRKSPVVLSLRPEQVLLASWAKRPCFYFKISIFPKEMQSVEITLFVWDKLWPDCILGKKKHYQCLQSGTAQRNIW